MNVTVVRNVLGRAWSVRVSLVYHRATHRASCQYSRTTGFLAPSSAKSCLRCGAAVKGRRRNGYCSDRCRMQDRRGREKEQREQLFRCVDHVVSALREDVLVSHSLPGSRQPTHAFTEACLDVVFPRLLEYLHTVQQLSCAAAPLADVLAPLCLLFVLGSRSDFQELDDVVRRRCEVAGV